MKRLLDLVKRHPLASGAGGLLLAGLGIWLLIGFFGVQGLFIDDEVSEDAPFATSALVGEGRFVDRVHPTTGRALIITDRNRTFLRFEGFETDNGPDLNVYLSTAAPDGDPDDFVDLGDLKGNIGDQNYEIPADVDLARYRTVFIWCVRFGVAFGAARVA